MAARYHVRVVDEIMAQREIPWPEGLRPVERGETGLHGSHWWLFEDDNAPDELDGKRVELSLARIGRETGIMTITERRVL